MKRSSKKALKEFAIITIGLLLVSCGLFFFLMPSNIAAGGINGLSIVLRNFIPLSVGSIMLIVNVILFVVAFIFLGSGFGGKTIYASLGISFTIMVLEKIYPNRMPFTNDLILEVFFGVTLSAIGIGLIVNQNASSGGTDILGMILNKYTGLDFGKALLLCDFIITMGAVFHYGPELGMYGLFGVIINGIIVDYIISGLNHNKEVTVISSRIDEIQEFIFDDLDRGVTLYKGIGGFTKHEKLILKTVIDSRDLVKLKLFIQDIDPSAFVTVTNTAEVLGHGFNNIN